MAGTNVRTQEDIDREEAEKRRLAGLPQRTPEQEKYYREHQGRTQTVSGEALTDDGKIAGRQWTYEENRLAGEYRGDETGARDAEIRKRRSLNASGPAGALALPPDLADIALRDISTGRQRRARGGSSSSALGLFNPTAPLTGVR